jgi:hypothetical protein
MEPRESNMQNGENDNDGEMEAVGSMPNHGKERGCSHIPCLLSGLVVLQLGSHQTLHAAYAW